MGRIFCHHRDRAAANAGLLDELESRVSDDLDVRLRLAVGRNGTAEQTSIYRGNGTDLRFSSSSSTLEILSVDHFLAMASVVPRFATNYCR